MIELTEEMTQQINNARADGVPCIVCTASPGGTPNAGYIGTVLSIGHDSFVYRDRSGRPTLENIEDNPKVVLLYREPVKDIGWKFRCTATVYRDGPEYDQLIGRLFESGLITDPESKTAAVVLQVDQVLTLFGEIMQERNPGSVW